MKRSMRPPGAGSAWPLFGFALLPLIAAASVQASPTLPGAGKVVSGSATIAAPKGGTLTIDQTSSRAIIDWSSFSIGAAGQVVFDNGSGATLNRVTGNDASLISGLLTATGSVYLINPRGVIIDRDGVVKVGGTFAASTLDLSNAQFIAGGDLTFAGPSNAAVINYGKIGALGGDVTLIAATVDNAGSIEAADGTAGLVAGYRVLLRDRVLNDGRFAVLLGGARTSVANNGVIEAADAELRANGGNVYALAGNTDGIISATGVRADQGRVWLIAEGGALDVAGVIEAQGADGSAGAIETSGRTVSLGVATIDAHGGIWRVDPYDLTVNAAAGSTIDASLAADTSVTLQTTASGTSGPGAPNPGGNGDIIVDAPISWATSAALTMSAYRNIDVNAAISLAHGTLNLTANNATTGVGAIAVNAMVEVTGAGTVNLSAATVSAGGKSYVDYSFAQGASINYGPTDNGGALTINGHGYTLLYLLSEPGSTGPDNGTDDIAGINNNTAAGGDNGYYALATDLTQPSGVVYTTGLVGLSINASSYFSGVFEGLGHTITGLTIDDTNTGDVTVALFANLNFGDPTIRDLGLVGGSVTAMAGIGGAAGLVANSNGLVLNDYNTGSVTCNSATCHVGDLIGVQYYSAVVNSYATGAVTGVANSYVGGLVGYNEPGAIIDCYANGAVRGGSGAYVGGLAGENVAGGTIVGAYATGAVSGGEYLDGLAYTHGATITDGYYDADTTGQPLGTQSSGSVGLSTTALKASLPAGFSSAVWGQDPGLSYPYLLSFTPYIPQPETISGVVHSGLAAGVLAGVTVDVVLNGDIVLGSATTNAEGVYSLTVGPGTLPVGSTVVTYLAGTSVVADSVADDIGPDPSLSGLNLYGGALTIHSPDRDLSALAAGLALGLGTATKAAGSDILFSVSGGVLSLKGGDSLNLVSTGAGFAFDESLNLGSGTLKLTTAGGVSQSGGEIKAALLEGSFHATLELTDAGNAIAALGPVTDGAGTIDLTDAEALAVRGSVTAARNITLTTTAGGLDLTRALSTTDGTVSLEAAGKVDETGALATITEAGGDLAIASRGGADLGSANTVASLDLVNTGGGTVAYKEAGALHVDAASNAGGSLSLTTSSGALSLAGAITGDKVSLVSAGTIVESAAGTITATSLTGSAQGAVTLGQANHIAALDAFTDTAGNFTLKDGQALAQAGTLDSGGYDIALTTTAGNIAIDGTIEASTLTLDARAGALTESGAIGAIEVGRLNATAASGITLTGAHNDIVTIGTNSPGTGPDKITQ